MLSKIAKLTYFKGELMLLITKNQFSPMKKLFIILNVMDAKWLQSSEIDSNVQFAMTLTYAKSVRLITTMILLIHS